MGLTSGYVCDDCEHLLQHLDTFSFSDELFVLKLIVSPPQDKTADGLCRREKNVLFVPLNCKYRFNVDKILLSAEKNILGDVTFQHSRHPRG